MTHALLFCTACAEQHAAFAVQLVLYNGVNMRSSTCSFTPRVVYYPCLWRLTFYRDPRSFRDGCGSTRLITSSTCSGSTSGTLTAWCPIMFGVMTSEDLLAAVLRLTESLDLVGSVTYGRPDSKIATIEACAHEIAHRVFTGPEFEHRLDNMLPWAANRHEASALRVEVTVLDRLGCKVHLRTLWSRANWKYTDRSSRPAWASMTVPLTMREHRCTLVMIRWLQRALDTIATDQSPPSLYWRRLWAVNRDV